MRSTKEQQILKIIKFTPPIFIIITSILITVFLFFENQKNFQKEKSKIEQEYIKENKEIIKQRVERVYGFLSHFEKITEEDLRKNIKDRVYEAHGIATRIYEKYKNEKTKEEIFSLIRTSIADLRFNDGRGYFFFDDINGKKVIYPIDKNIEGKILLDFTDAKGYKFVKTIVQTVKDKSERFDTYYWYKPNSKDKKTYKKISFYKYFEPYNLVIGTGEYIDDYQKIIQKRVLDYVKLLRYEKTGYVFILDYEGNYLSHLDESLLGKNVKDIYQNKDRNFFNNMLEISKNGSAYYSYVQKNKPGTKEEAKKLSYIKGINSWSWIVGTGFYEDEALKEIEELKQAIDNEFSKTVENIVVASIFLTFVLLIASIYVSKLLENKLNEYKFDLSKQQSLLFQQSKMAAMGEMIGNIAHQWRQPLSTISTLSSGMELKKQMDDLDDEFFYESTQKISSSTKYLSKTIDDFRNFFSPNKEKDTFELSSTIETTLELIKAQFTSKDIEIKKDIQSIELFTYENELIQSLINILNNARDELIKKPADYRKLLFISTIKEDNKVLISIKDNAGGVNPMLIDRIFEPYFTTKHKSQGTGIGLYMVEEIVVKHLKGTIELNNVKYTYDDIEYKGAEFIICLPIS